MYEQEKQRATHLMILLYKTFFMTALTGVSIFLKWDMGAVVLLLLGYAVSWLMHITEKIPESIRLWMYLILTMLAFFFFGIHEIVIYDMAPVMVLFILVYSFADERAFVRLCAAAYCMTMCYDFVFLLGNPLKLPIDTILRIILHFAIVFMAERFAETMIQKRKKEREKAGERISQLEETNRRAEDFLANVSHELRTPINAVTGITAVMLKNEEDPEKKKDMLSIQMAGNRLFGQIEDILDYTEVDSGRIIISKENYMIASLINDIIVENRLTLREKELELIFDVDAGIPSILLGDGRKIKKILMHLIDNAIKFTKRGGVYVRIYALHKTYGINLCIKVSDTGVGIAEDELGKIKERFFQSDGGRKRRAGGLGLGLSIVYGMVTAMDGFIQLESVEGSGTTVSVSIPQKVVDAAPSMEVPNRSDLCIALYLRQEKYELPEVRDYYNTMISHMVREMDLTVHRVFALEELKKLVDMYRLTHLIIGKEEYEESASYYEALDKGTEVVVVADDRFQLAEDSRVNLVRKPYYGLPIINILNTKTSIALEGLERNNMVCPGVRVLVVDDEPMNLMVAEGIFKVYQMEVKTAGSGIEAIELCKKEEFDLIFLDHMMPEMDGVETLRILRKNQMDTGKKDTIIAFTANAVSGAREMFLQEGFDGFISKPIEEQELKRLLNKVLPNNAIIFVENNDRKKLPEKAQTGKAKQGIAEQISAKQDITEQDTAEQDTAGQDVAEQDVAEQISANQDVAEQISAKQDITGRVASKPGVAEQVDAQEPIPGNDPKKDKMAYLKEKGFQTEAGLQYCHDDSEFYEEVLVLFAKEAGNKITDIETAFREEDYKNYEIMVHALKSTSKIMGANTLSEMAKEAEAAAKNQDAAYIRANNQELLGKYRETAQCILDVLCPAEAALPDATAAAGTEVSEEELQKYLSELGKCLDTFEADRAEALLAEMDGFVYRGTSVSELLRDVRQDVEDFELSAAAGKVEELINGIKD